MTHCDDDDPDTRTLNIVTASVDQIEMAPGGLTTALLHRICIYICPSFGIQNLNLFPYSMHVVLCDGPARRGVYTRPC